MPYNGEKIEDMEINGVIIFPNDDKPTLPEFELIFSRFLRENNWRWSGVAEPMDWDLPEDEK